MSNYDDTLVEKAVQAFRAAWHDADERMRQPNSGLAVPGYRSEQGVRAALDAVADNLRAEGGARALRGFADATRLPADWVLFREEGGEVTVSNLLREVAYGLAKEAQR